MKFLIGLILGGTLAVVIMSNHEPRPELLQVCTHLVEQAKQLYRAPRTADSRAPTLWRLLLAPSLPEPAASKAVAPR